MENLCNVTAAVLCVAVIILCVRYTVHMFQLNAYQYRSHRRFLKSHLVKSLFPLTGVAAAVLLQKECQPWAAAAGIVYLLILLWLFFPGKAKKKLVYTARVKRLLATTAILLLAAAGILIFPAGLLPVPVLLGLSAVSQYIVLLANLLNRPMEKGINRYYIRDAKKMLRSCPGLKVIGITGSYGKTSVKYYLYTLLSAGFDVLMTPESYNTPMGVVKTIRGSLRATHEIFLCEMGARHVGDIKEICDIVEPDMGVITSLGCQHLETFYTLDNIVNTKKELFDALSQGAPRYINGDNEFAKQYQLTGQAVTYGLEEGNAYRAFDLTYSEKGSVFKVKAPDGSVAEYTTKMLGEHNVVNITGAIAIAHDLGIPLEKLILPVRRLEGAPHRLQPIDRGSRMTIIDDAYNSNPNGTKVALKTLSMFDGIKVLVTPGMVELGSEEDKYNFEFGEAAAKVCDYIVLVGRRQTESLKEGVCAGGFNQERLYVAENLQAALDYVYSMAADRKLIVLLENDLPDNYL